MFKVVQKNNVNKFVEFKTKEEAQAFLASKGRAANFFRIEEVVTEPAANTEERDWKKSIDWSDAVQITRNNVRLFYKKMGYIKVINPAGKTLHIGRTRNMGKVFSNYVNCNRYNQSYDFNLDRGDRLFFKETESF